MEEVNNPITMAVDLKKYGIRIHKTVFRLIGEPKYIQLLVNPTARYVAIRGVEESYSRDQTHKVNKRRMETAHGYEIYCKDLMRKLCMVVGGLDEGHGYRLTGRIVPEENMAVFSLDTLQRVEK